MKSIVKKLLVSLTVGFSVGSVYLGFVNSVEYMQNLIWFDVFDVGQNKVLIIPLSILGGLILSGFIYLFNKHKFDVSNINLFDSDTNIPKNFIVISLFLGFTSLVVGASLGPEAILLPVSFALGIILSKMYFIKQPKIFGMLGVIALLAAFFNSWFAGLIPLSLIAIKKHAKPKEVILLIIMGLFSVIGSLAALNAFNNHSAYLTLNNFGSFSVTPKLIFFALVVSALLTLLPNFTHKLSKKFNAFNNAFPKNWVLRGFVAGSGVAILYYLLGPVVFFSGSAGVSELIINNSEYTSFQLIGFMVGKILLTAWCLGTIYKGGIVFPLIFSGTSLALLLSGGIPDASWLVSLLVATFFGIFYGTFGSFVIAIVFILSLFGLSVWPIILSAAVGSFIVKSIYKKPFAEKLIQ